MFGDIKDFYPTPEELIRDMVHKVDMRKVKTILEPSAGKGNIVDYVQEHNKIQDIDCIEADQNLRHILKGKGYRVVQDDFLNFNTYKNYDLLIMNPPFSTGELHLLRAIEMQQYGGQIVCLLNAETIRKPYTNTRKDLLRKLEDYNADIKYIQHAFISAENTTDVEIAMVYLNIPNRNKISVILEDLRKEEKYSCEKHNYTDVVAGNFIERIIQQYNFEIRAGIKLISEYKNLQPLIMTSFDKENTFAEPILSLDLGSNRRYGHESHSADELVNLYIESVRFKYWNALFSSKEFGDLLTSNLRQSYSGQIQLLANYDFSYYNIKQIQLDINKNMMQGIEETILKLFETFSEKHYWYDETSKNIHYYNGWKTNSSYKINKRVIIPLDAFDRYDHAYDCNSWSVKERLKDVEKVFNYLDGNLTEEVDICKVLEEAYRERKTKNIKTKYFDITFYKKGTCHLTFLNEELLKKFNIFGCGRKGWLPPSYGRKTYESMSDDEKQVIDDFEGKDSYNETVRNSDYYLFNPSKVLSITDGLEQKESA